MSCERHRLCVRGCAFARHRASETQRENVNRKRKLHLRLPRSLSITWCVRSVAVFLLFLGKKVFFTHHLGKLDVDWRTMFENVLYFMLCAFATTMLLPSATILFWVNGTLEVSGAITVSSFPFELQVKRTKKKRKQRGKDEFYKHLKNKRYDPYTHAHRMSANRDNFCLYFTSSLKTSRTFPLFRNLKQNEIAPCFLIPCVCVCRNLWAETQH